jgi:hypothetical protein
MNWYKNNQSNVIFFNQIDKIIKSISSRHDLNSGNCGMFALGLGAFAQDNGFSDIKIWVATNAENMEELTHGEPDIYHIMVSINGIFYDGNGRGGSDSLQRFSKDVYQDPKPFIYSFAISDTKIVQLISRETNYDAEAGYFYNLIKKLYSTVNY